MVQSAVEALQVIVSPYQKCKHSQVLIWPNSTVNPSQVHLLRQVCELLVDVFIVLCSYCVMNSGKHVLDMLGMGKGVPSTSLKTSL